MKDDSTKERAEDLFVVHQLKMAEIATRLGLSPKTLYNWKKSGNWDAKRTAITSAEIAFHAEIYELARTMSRGIRKDIEDGKAIDSARYYALSRLVETAKKSHDYEMEAPPKPEEHDPHAPRKTLEQIKSEIFGL